jgi:predicted transcriptional regulator
MEKKLKVTPARCVFLRMLSDGPKTWKDLREAYYGPERAKSKASTSFHNQVEKQQTLGLIQHVDGHYELTAKGIEMLKLVDDEKLAGAKSIAQQKFEAKA